MTEAEAKAKDLQKDTSSAQSSLRFLKPSLPIWEITFYTASWIFGIGFASYHVFLASSRYFRFLDDSDMQYGWFGPGRWRKDISDSEWLVFTEVLINSVPWLILHVIGSQLLKRMKTNNLIPLFYVLLGWIYFSKCLHLKGLLFLLIAPFLIFLTFLLGQPSLVYAVALGLTVIYDVADIVHSEYFFTKEDYKLKYIASVMNAWNNARAMSFCLDILWKDVEWSGNIFEEFINLYSYCFYLPLAVSGPLVNYNEFHKGVNSSYVPWTSERLKHLFFGLLHYGFWFLGNNLILHAFYFGALQFDLHLMNSFDLWTLCGIGFAMGQFFYMKYLVLYGIPRMFLYSDEISSPSSPKCIARIHLYSDMWRYFDNGLYLYIQKYFYRVVIGRLNGNLLSKLFASAVTFCFVYIWHGTQEQVKIWSLLNFLGITFEATAKTISTTQPYIKVERAILSPRGRRRFYSLLGAPLYMMSCLSNFYFLMGVNNGNLIAYKACLSWHNFGTPIILFFLYCGAQTSYEIKNWEIKRNYLIKENKKKN